MRSNCSGKLLLRVKEKGVILLFPTEKFSGIGRSSYTTILLIHSSIQSFKGFNIFVNIGNYFVTIRINVTRFTGLSSESPFVN